MKCNNCKAEWKPPIGVSITQCPFCGKPLFEIQNSKKNAEPHDILYEIVQQYDSKILGEIKLKGILSDLMPHIEKKYQRIFKQALDDKIGLKLLELADEDNSIRIVKLKTLKDSFKNHNGFNDVADYVFDCFLFALGWIETVNKERYEQGGVDKLSVVNQQIDMAFIDLVLSKEEAKMLFSTGLALGVSENEIADLINAKIENLNLKPNIAIKKSLKSQKEIICSSDWVQKKQNINPQNENTSGSKIEYDSFTDSRDGRKYKTVKIGNQIWMAENLAYDIGRDCWAYENNERNVNTYGRLYTWEAAKRACPSGWHLPSDDEWKELEMAIGMSRSDVDKIGLRGTNEGIKLKATSGWEGDGKGTDVFGFSALPGGSRYNYGSFDLIGYFGYWWSATEDLSLYAWTRGLNYGKANVYRDNYLKGSGISVRCVRD